MIPLGELLRPPEPGELSPVITPLVTSTERWLSRFITQDVAMLQIKEHVTKLSAIRDSVLITGETGTGKELIARALHSRPELPFIAVNLAGLPEQLVESELFGHTRGSFTGAAVTTKGLFEAAGSGTLFLDECSSLPMNCQAKLLRVLQERTIRKVGATSEIPIRCRVIAATNADMSRAIKRHEFREDLFWRLATFTIQLSPLRQRRSDVPLIIESLDPEHLVPTSLVEQWSNSPLMGNVRELQSNVRKYHVLGC